MANFGPKIVDIRKGEIRSTIRRAFNKGLSDCRNVVLLFEGQNGGIYMDWSSVDKQHSVDLLKQAAAYLQTFSKDRA